MWRPDIPFIEQRPARLHGWVRRFWQGSHDHRGTPNAPGRVVTLIADENAYTDGIAYRLPAKDRAGLLAALDHREKNGYQRLIAPILFRDASLDQLDTQAHEELSARAHEPLRNGTIERKVPGTTASCLVYVAEPDNHAFLGAAPPVDIVRQIAASVGPSGRNIDYLFDLSATLRKLGIVDEHVFELETLARQYALHKVL